VVDATPNFCFMVRHAPLETFTPLWPGYVAGQIRLSAAVTTTAPPRGCS
jgi:hypothetical protein